MYDVLGLVRPMPVTFMGTIEDSNDKCTFYCLNLANK